jgi:single-stranded-DNA-specific exonuclease
MSSISLKGEIKERLGKAYELVNSASKIRVVSHYDADGISAAAVLTGALLQLSKIFQVTMTRSLDEQIVSRLAEEKFDLFIFSDMGSGQIELLKALKANVIILDHHKSDSVNESKKVVHINPMLWGVDGTREVCGSTTSYLLAEELSEQNRSLIPCALAGAYGDMQHMGGFTGLNAEILRLGIESGYVEEINGLTLEGENLVEAFTSSTQPYLKGYSGRESLIVGLFDSIDVDAHKPFHEYTDEERRKVASVLMLMLASSGCDYDQVSRLVTIDYISSKRKMRISEISSLANACGRSSMYATGLAMELGDAEATEEAKKLRVEYTQKMFERLHPLEDGGVEQTEHLQYFRSDDPALAGALAGIYMSYIGAKNKPTISFSLVGDSYKISARGTKALVEKGLDLAAGLSQASKKVGGTGGGHVIAAGATIPKEKLSEFIKELETIVAAQLERRN